MADISKIILPNGDNYDLKVYTDHIAPMLSRTFTGVIGTANDWANAVFFYGKILPLSYSAVWRIHYRIYVEAAGRDDSKAIADVTITGTKSTMSAYASFNAIANTSYRPAYHNELYRATSAGITNGYGHALGIRLQSSWNPTTAANARTVTIDILSTENCTFEFFDDMTKYANVPGTGETNYSAYTELDWTANGLQETGDLNYVDRMIMSSTQLIAGSGGIMQYALIMQDGSDTWQGFTVTNGTATTKTKNTVGFKPGKLYYASTSSNIPSGNTVGAVYWSIPFDSRYSLNAGNTLTNHKPLYIVFTYGNDGLLYLEDTWWTQDLPTTQDNKYYMFVGYVYGSGYSTWLAPENPIYKYVDGKVVEWKFDTYVTHAEDAGTVDGHVVLSDVPSNAVFTDTITAVKGNAESSYRTGNVNITPANIGTIPLSTGGTGQTSAVEGNWALQNRGNCSDANAALSVGIYTTTTDTLNLPALAYSQNNGCGVLLCYVNNASTHNNTSNWIWQIWLNTTTSDLYKRKKINAGTWGAWSADTDTAATLKTARTLNVSGQATGTAQAFDGSQDVSIPITSYNTQGLVRPSGIRGVNDNTLQALFNTTRANRLAFLPADQIIIEKTTDGGVTWVDAGVSDATKLGLFSETRSTINIPQIDGVRSPLCGVRVTFTAMKYDVPENTPETEKYNYWNSTYVTSAERYNQLKDFYFWLSASDGSIKIKIEGAKASSANNWETLFDDPSYYMTGWSGNDYVHLSVQRLFGGIITQTSNAYWNYRMTFMSWGKNGTDDFDTGSKTQIQTIAEIRGYGDSWWTAGNTYAAYDRIYSQDMNKNVIFPAKVTAASFAGSLTGNVTGNATTATTATSVSTTGAATTNAFRHVWFSDANSETKRTHDDNFQYNPNTKTLTTNISGSAAKVNNHTVQSDVPENAVFTDTTYTGTSPVTVSGTTISHANSGVTAASKGDTANQTPTWGDTFKVLSGTVNATGHLTEFAEHTVTIPSAVATTSTNGLMSSSDKTSLNTLTTQMSTAQTDITSLQSSVTALGNLILCGTGKQVTSSKWSSSGEEVYLYKADVAMTGVDSSYFPLVQFDDADINSFEFSPKTTPKTNAVTIYCKTKPNRTITIPNIICFKGKSV